MSKTISHGVVHKVPADLRKALTSDRAAFVLWEDLTPLARNEWICWVTFVKKDETRKEHVKRTVSELKEGMRRPCCWLGCIHRMDKAISPSVRAVLDGRSKKSGSTVLNGITLLKHKGYNGQEGKKTEDQGSFPPLCTLCPSC